MELRHLRYFVAVAELLHFGRAARRLHIAQPSLSHQILQLESELGAKLLERTRRKVDLTEAGRVFLVEAREILARADHAALVARRASGEGLGRLRIAYGYCMDPRVVVEAVGAFRRRHPVIPVEVRTIAVPDQITALREGKLDVGFVRPPVLDDQLNSAELVSEALVVALPLGHRAVAEQRLSLAALAREAFVLVPRDAPVYHDAVLQACREAGFLPHAPYEADHLQVLLGLVATGAGIALVPASARQSLEVDVVFRSLEPPVPVLGTAIVWRDPSPILSEFVELALEASRRLGALADAAD